MPDNVFGMDIKRFSVLFIAIIIILSFVANFTNIKTPQQNTSVQVGTQTQTENYTQPKLFNYVYNKTIVLAPSLTDLQYVRASYANTKAPYYNVSKNAYILFNFSTPYSNALELLLNALARNASEIAPGPYGALLSIASSAYASPTSYANTTLQPFPLNANDTENYSKWLIILRYAKSAVVPNQFQPGWSYPPSDNVTSGISILNKISSSTNYAYLEAKILKYSYTLTNTQTYCYSTPAAVVHVTVDTYSFIADLSFQVFYDGKATSDIFAENFTGNFEQTSIAVVGPGFYDYCTYTSPYTTDVSQSYTHPVPGGNYTFMPGSQLSIAFSVQTTPLYSYFTEYEYAVTVPISVTVSNGTDPVTVVSYQLKWANGSCFSYSNITTNRTASLYVSYDEWAIDPAQLTVTITTSDSIQVGNYTIPRVWHAVSGSINSIQNITVNTTSNATYTNETLDVTNDLSIPVQPSWITQSMTYNRYATIDWFYLEQNASLAHALYEFIMKTINESDLPYWKFQYSTLASEYVMNTINTSYSAYNDLLELESFFENYSFITANITSLSSWPNLNYLEGDLLFINVSRVPTIYNNTVFLNVSGNNEVYLMDVYNGLKYNQFDRVPFGNMYYFFNPVNDQTVYFYREGSQTVPYIGEKLVFITADYIPSLFYATYLGSGKVVNVTAIWNGTAWIT